MLSTRCEGRRHQGHAQDLRTGEKKPFEVTLVRAPVQVDKVKWHREADIGYIRIPGFNEQTDDGVQQAVRDLKKQIGPRSRAM